MDKVFGGKFLKIKQRRAVCSKDFFFEKTTCSLVCNIFFLCFSSTAELPMAWLAVWQTHTIILCTLVILWLCSKTLRTIRLKKIMIICLFSWLKRPYVVFWFVYKKCIFFSYAQENPTMCTEAGFWGYFLNNPTKLSLTSVEIIFIFIIVLCLFFGHAMVLQKLWPMVLGKNKVGISELFSFIFFLGLFFFCCLYLQEDKQVACSAGNLLLLVLTAHFFYSKKKIFKFLVICHPLVFILLTNTGTGTLWGLSVLIMGIGTLMIVFYLLYQKPTLLSISPVDPTLYKDTGKNNLPEVEELNKIDSQQVLSCQRVINGIKEGTIVIPKYPEIPEF